MPHPFGWAALSVLVIYLALFFWGGTEAERASGRSIWLFGAVQGLDRIGPFGFRAAFMLSFSGPLLVSIFPGYSAESPIWNGWLQLVLGLIGVALAAGGAMLAFAAQMSMGASWRVGVKAGETGDLVVGGLFRISRNPTFLGQAALLFGVALAAPSVLTIIAPILFLASATFQIRQEEAVLLAALGEDYSSYRNSVPRWIRLWP